MYKYFVQPRQLYYQRQNLTTIIYFILQIIYRYKIGIIFLFVIKIRYLNVILFPLNF